MSLSLIILSWWFTVSSLGKARASFSDKREFRINPVILYKAPKYVVLLTMYQIAMNWFLNGVVEVGLLEMSHSVLMSSVSVMIGMYVAGLMMESVVKSKLSRGE